MKEYYHERMHLNLGQDVFHWRPEAFANPQSQHSPIGLVEPDDLIDVRTVEPPKGQAPTSKTRQADIRQATSAAYEDSNSSEAHMEDGTLAQAISDHQLFTYQLSRFYEPSTYILNYQNSASKI